MLPLVLFALFAGCGEHHLVDGARDAGPADVATFPDSFLPDAGDRPDAFTIDAPAPIDVGSGCVAQIPHHYCQDAPIPAGEPFALPLRYDGCFCEDRAHCVLEDVTRSGQIRLRTEFCPSLALCGECVPEIDATCEIPPLPAGPYQIVVNGEPVGALDVGDAPFFDRACQQLSTVDGCGASTPVPGRPDRFDEVCVRQEGDHHRLRLIDRCAECPAYPGLCNARVVDRVDRFFPPGSDIHLDARIYDGACDGACDDSCHLAERDCVLPEVEPDFFYRVFVGDEEVFAFTGGEATCSGP